MVPFGLVPYPTYPPSQRTFFSPCIEHTVNYKLMRPKFVTFLRTLVIHSGGYRGSFVEAIILLYILWERVVLLNTNNCLKPRCICRLSGQNRWASKEKKNTLCYLRAPTRFHALPSIYLCFKHLWLTVNSGSASKRSGPYHSVPSNFIFRMRFQAHGSLLGIFLMWGSRRRCSKVSRLRRITSATQRYEDEDEQVESDEKGKSLEDTGYTLERLYPLWRSVMFVLLFAKGRWLPINSHIVNKWCVQKGYAPQCLIRS